MRFATAAIAALAIAPTLAPVEAHAGGVGAVAAAGVFSERVWYYDANETSYQTQQPIINGGTGLELMLGDRDDRITGYARFYWNMELPEPDVTQSTLEGEQPWTAPRRDTVRNTGIFTVGIQAGVAGDPNKGMFVVTGAVGSGFLTPDHREFVFGEVGAGGTLRVSPGLELYGTVNGHVRYRKWARLGATTYGGVRVLFD